jgi:hypothetical protein
MCDGRCWRTDSGALDLLDKRITTHIQNQRELSADAFLSTLHVELLRKALIVIKINLYQ